MVFNISMTLILFLPFFSSWSFFHNLTFSPLGNALRVISGDFGNLATGFPNTTAALRHTCLILGPLPSDLGESSVSGELVIVVAGGEVVAMGDSILGDFRDPRGEFINPLVPGEAEDNVICGTEIQRILRTCKYEWKPNFHL